MFSELSAAFSSVKAMTEIVKGMNALKQEADINAKSVELTAVIIEIQQRLMATNSEMEALHETIKQLKARIAEKDSLDDYIRVKLQTGTVVYGLKADKKVAGAPDYYVCPHCLEKDKVAITLQDEHGDPYLRCRACTSVYQARPDSHNGNLNDDYDRYS